MKLTTKVFLATFLAVVAALAIGQVNIQFPNGAPAVGQALVFTNTSGQLGYYTPPIQSAVAPNSQTGTNYAIVSTDNTVIYNGSGLTLTLPAASAANAGRRIRLLTITTHTVISATSNVVPCAGGAAGTAILAATAGKWADLESDGVANWDITACN